MILFHEKIWIKINFRCKINAFYQKFIKLKWLWEYHVSNVFKCHSRFNCNTSIRPNQLKYFIRKSFWLNNWLCKLDSSQTWYYTQYKRITQGKLHIFGPLLHIVCLNIIYYAPQSEWVNPKANWILKTKINLQEASWWSARWS